MCGIAAVLKASDTKLSLRSVHDAAQQVIHRGPDGGGIVGLNGAVPVRSLSDTSWEVGLGFRRLAIIDVSEAGNQPMAYRDRYWMVYNGEVYNYLELRHELERLGHAFRSHSDTEVILAAFAEWGTACFARFRGMWGLVLYDVQRREVTLSRDHMGIKPLYVWRAPACIAVASEIKQFQRLPGFRPHTDELAAAEFLDTGYEDPSRSFFQDVVPLAAGTSLTIPLADLSGGRSETHWHPERVVVSITDRREAATRFATKLDECVRLHLRSDVPVGCALSGGLDSSAIAVAIDSLMPSGSSRLNTFSVTFPGDRTDERTYADAVIRRVSAVPRFRTPKPSEFLEDLTRFVWHHDEPVGGFSIYAGYCLARLTRESGVTVLLNGQGGDELLSGYWQSYFLYLRELVLGGKIAAALSHLAGAGMRDGNSALLSQIPVMLRRYRARRTALDGKSSSDLLKRVLSQRGQARRVQELRHFHLPRLLKWEDRNSMAFSVEGRYPFLDREIIDLCLSFSSDVLFYRGWSKMPLRHGFNGRLPAEIIERRSKFGFEVPQDRWLCGPMRSTIEQWLDSDRPLWDFRDRGGIRRLAEETWRLEGRHPEPGQALFRALVFDRWLEVFAVTIPRPLSTRRSRPQGSVDIPPLPQAPGTGLPPKQHHATIARHPNL